MSSGGLILNGLPRTRPSWRRNRASPGGQRNGAFAFCGSPARFACLILWPALASRVPGLSGRLRTFGPVGPAPSGMYVVAVAQAGGAQAHGVFIRLDRGESMRLLASAPVGRLIFTVTALPAVRLMNFAVADGLILLRAAAGTTVARKVHDAIVAFEPMTWTRRPLRAGRSW